MAIIRFDANVAIEVALKFDRGMQVKSRIPDAPDQMMYTVCGDGEDDTIYVPLSVGAQIENLGVKRLELISICKRVQHRATRWEVKRVGDAAAAPIAPQSQELEAEVAAAIPYVQQRRASLAKQQEATNSSKSTPPPAALATVPAPCAAPGIDSIIHTIASQAMAGALIAAVDAVREAQAYAQSHGLELGFSAEDVRAIAATLFITASKDPSFLQQGRVNGETQPWRQ